MAGLDAYLIQQADHFARFASLKLLGEAAQGSKQRVSVSYLQTASDKKGTEPVLNAAGFK